MAVTNIVRPYTSRNGKTLTANGNGADDRGGDRVAVAVGVEMMQSKPTGMFTDNMGHQNIGTKKDTADWKTGVNLKWRKILTCPLPHPTIVHN